MILLNKISALHSWGPRFLVLLLLGLCPASQAGTVDDVDRLIEQLQARPFDPEPPTQALVTLSEDRPEIVVDLMKRCVETRARFRWRDAMRWTIGAAGSAAVPGLRLAILDEGHIAPIRDEAAATLAECNLETRLALLPELTKALEDEDGRLVQMASSALASLGERALPAYPTLTNLLTQASPRSRVHYIRPMMNLGSAAEPAIPLVKKALREVDGSWGERMVTHINRSQGDPELVMPLLIDALKRRDGLIRRAAAYAVINHRAYGGMATPVLKELLLTDQRPNVRYALAEALATVDPSQTELAVQILVEMLKDQSEAANHGRPHAATALGRFGSDAKPALPVLQRILEDNLDAALEEVTGGPESEEQWLARSVMYGLGGIGPEAQSTLPTLKRVAADGGLMAAVVAQWACIRIAPEEKELLRGVLDRLKSVDRNQSLKAIHVLGMLKPKSPAVQSALVDALDDVRWQMRLRAAVALAMDGLGGEKTQSVLISGLTCGEAHLLYDVKEALQQATTNEHP